MKIRIRVTNSDIKNSKSCNARECAVATAAGRVLKNSKTIMVSGWGEILVKDGTFRPVNERIRQRLEKFIEDFDNRRRVNPTSSSIPRDRWCPMPLPKHERIIKDLRKLPASDLTFILEALGKFIQECCEHSSPLVREGAVMGLDGAKDALMLAAKNNDPAAAIANEILAEWAGVDDLLTEGET